jgi:hypothetical protein
VEGPALVLAVRVLLVQGAEPLAHLALGLLARLGRLAVQVAAEVLGLRAARPRAALEVLAQLASTWLMVFTAQAAAARVVDAQIQTPAVLVALAVSMAAAVEVAALAPQRQGMAATGTTA